MGPSDNRDMGNPGNGSQLFLNPNDYFRQMVESGFQHRKIKGNSYIQSYLVSLLEKYMLAEQLNQNQETLAELFLKANQVEAPERIELLRSLGDKSLYISGFFADSLNRKLVDVDYYIQMGGAAYGQLAHVVKEDTSSQLYRTFSLRFVDFVEVLSYISQASNLQNNSNLLRLYERYIRTGSSLARELLAEAGVVTVPLDQAKASQQDDQ